MAKLYLDTCAFSRLLDERSQPRVANEYAAVVAIVERFESGVDTLIISDHSFDEVFQIRTEVVRNTILMLFNLASTRIRLTEEIGSRASELTSLLRLKASDALHVAAAETEAEFFLTTDDRLHRACLRLSDSPGIRVLNPVDYIQGVDGT